MKVNGEQPSRVAELYGKELNRTREAAKEKKAEAGKSADAQGPGADQVIISDQAREIRAYQEKLAQLPDERPEVVGRLRREVAAGTYRVDARKVADALTRGRVDRLI